MLVREVAAPKRGDARFEIVLHDRAALFDFGVESGIRRICTLQAVVGEQAAPSALQTGSDELVGAFVELALVDGSRIGVPRAACLPTELAHSQKPERAERTPNTTS